MKTSSALHCFVTAAVAALGFVGNSLLGADDPDLALGVRKTEPVSPADQAKAF